MRDLVKEAIDVQDACNLAGVLLGAHNAARELRALLPAADTGFINRHPVMRAWACKIADLSGNYDGAYPLEELSELRALGYSPTYTAATAPAPRDEPGDCPGEFDAAADAFADSLKRRRAA
jgi:hypothetical protein